LAYVAPDLKYFGINEKKPKKFDKNAILPARIEKISDLAKKLSLQMQNHVLVCF